MKKKQILIVGLMILFLNSCQSGPAQPPQSYLDVVSSMEAQIQKDITLNR